MVMFFSIVHISAAVYRENLNLVTQFLQKITIKNNRSVGNYQTNDKNFTYNSETSVSGCHNRRCITLAHA